MVALEAGKVRLQSDVGGFINQSRTTEPMETQ